jgi:DNA-binding MarR family transcriptional regulator
MATKQSPARQAARHPADALSLNSQLCFAVYSTMLSFNKVYRGLLRSLDLTYPQYLVMLVLWEQDGVNVSEICARVFLETTTLTPLLKRLETRGLLRRERSAVDERQVIVSLTSAGRELRAKAMAIPPCIGRATELSAEQIDGLREQLLSLRASLEKNV